MDCTKRNSRSTVFRIVPKFKKEKVQKQKISSQPGRWSTMRGKVQHHGKITDYSDSTKVMKCSRQWQSLFNMLNVLNATVKWLKWGVSFDVHFTVIRNYIVPKICPISVGTSSYETHKTMQWLLVCLTWFGGCQCTHVDGSLSRSPAIQGLGV